MTERERLAAEIAELERRHLELAEELGRVADRKAQLLRRFAMLPVD